MSTNQSTGANNITQFGMAVSDDDFVNCTGIDRNLWVTITRIAMPAPSLKSEETAEARLLQAVQDDITFVFYAVPGYTEPTSGIWMSISMTLMAACMMVMLAF